MSPTPVLQRGVVGVGYAFIKKVLAQALELRDSRRPFANLTNVRQYVFARKLAHLCALTICCTNQAVSLVLFTLMIGTFGA